MCSCFWAWWTFLRSGAPGSADIWRSSSSSAELSARKTGDGHTINMNFVQNALKAAAVYFVSLERKYFCNICNYRDKEVPFSFLFKNMKVRTVDKEHENRGEEAASVWTWAILAFLAVFGFPPDFFLSIWCRWTQPRSSSASLKDVKPLSLEYRQKYTWRKKKTLKLRRDRNYKHSCVRYDKVHTMSKNCNTTSNTGS